MNNQHSSHAREVRAHKPKNELHRLARNRDTLKAIDAVRVCCGMIVAAAEAIKQVCSDKIEQSLRLRPFWEKYKSALSRIFRRHTEIRRALERKFGRPETLDFAYQLTAVS